MNVYSMTRAQREWQASAEPAPSRKLRIHLEPPGGIQTEMSRSNMDQEHPVYGVPYVYVPKWESKNSTRLRDVTRDTQESFHDQIW